ncbi:hypothetical protein [Streptomyces buecherae]|uniref:Uncharacterized protein n=1 Tax=Streptomyces buecherae TaxID=2763006 RepID=A0A7H8NGK1_9ACTN|nr:hypothetical protein [Streptomyces buecherae]QKW53637.1 hypothetical protein HUT08_33410 [Streptomyces buecherae]
MAGNAWNIADAVGADPRPDHSGRLRTPTFNDDATPPPLGAVTQPQEALDDGASVEELVAARRRLVG